MHYRNEKNDPDLLATAVLHELLAGNCHPSTVGITARLFGVVTPSRMKPIEECLQQMLDQKLVLRGDCNQYHARTDQLPEGVLENTKSAIGKGPTDIADRLESGHSKKGH